MRQRLVIVGVGTALAAGVIASFRYDSSGDNSGTVDGSGGNGVAGKPADGSQHGSPVSPEEFPDDFIDLSFPDNFTYFSSMVTGRLDKDSYVQRGVGFRRAIQVLEDRQDPRLSQARDLYGRLKTANGGKEYLDNGEVFDPKFGDRFYIMDGSMTNQGIFLRVEASLARSGSSFLGDGMVVEIKTEAISVPDGKGGTTVMYGIRVVDNDSWLIGDDIKSSVGALGFVSAEFLGQKVKSGQTPQTTGSGTIVYQ